MQKIKVINPITRLIVGGAQETVIETCACINKDRFETQIVAGPQTGPEGELISEAKKRQIPLTLIPELVREINPVKDLIAAYKLVKMFKREQPHIVHTHSSKTGIIGRWAARLAGVPVIVHTVHGWGHHPYQQPLIQKIYIFAEQKTVPFTDKLIAVSTLNVDKGLKDHIGTREKYVVIHSCINLDDFSRPRVDPLSLRKALGLDAASPVVGTVSRLSKQKNPLDFVRMAAQVKKDIPTAQFLFVGDGPLRAETEALIRELHLEQDIILAGLRMDVPDLLHAMDIFTLTSLWEGLPRVIPQAMMAGLPVVANNVDGNAEIIRDGVNGFLTPPGNISLMAERIIRLFKDQPLKQAIVAQGRETAAQEFSLHDMVKKIETLYDELLTLKGITAKT
ncbi:MAG: glycosyltransferase family 4 protein [Proteobacteria bacterium]|nr:glycosyltransferase family 4 protein [Pseudomonadota bacterium]